MFFNLDLSSEGWFSRHVLHKHTVTNILLGEMRPTNSAVPGVGLEKTLQRKLKGLKETGRI